MKGRKFTARRTDPPWPIAHKETRGRERKRGEKGMRRRLSNSFLLIGVGLLILSMLLSAVSLAAVPGGQLQDVECEGPRLNISHVKCFEAPDCEGGEDEGTIEVHFVLVHAPDEGDITDYGAVSYQMTTPDGTVSGTASYAGHTGDTVHYEDYVSGGNGTYTVTGGSVTLTVDGTASTYNLANAGASFSVTDCECPPTPTPTDTPTPTPTPETPTPTPETPTPTPETPTPTPETPTPTPETPTPTPETPTPTPETPTPTPTPPPCPNATITVQVTECGAGVAGLSVELHSSWGDKYGPKTSPATFSVIGGSNRDWYAIVNGARMGATIKVTECGGTGTIGAVLPCVPTPTPVVEVLGVERLPVTGPVIPSPGVPSLLVGVSLLSITSGGLLRWFDRRG